MSAAADTFRAEAAKRILVKDGAYGTMIQAEKLAEADYRGALAFTFDQRGNNDLLNLTRPAVVRRSASVSSMPAPTSSPPTPSTRPRSASPITGPRRSPCRTR